MSIHTVVTKIAQGLKSFSLYGLWGWAGGRSFVLAAFFATTAYILAKHGLLTKEYAATIVSIQGFATWRTVHEDKKEVALAARKDDAQTDRGGAETGK